MHQTVNPLADGDRLSGPGICSEGTPVALGLVGLIRDGTFDDQNERIELAVGSKVERFQKVVADLVCQHRIVKFDCGNPWDSSQHHIFKTGLRSARKAMLSPSQPRPPVIQRICISGGGETARAAARLANGPSAMQHSR